MNRQPRIAVVSPFIDKRHGTERALAEQVERLAHRYGWEVHIFSQRVEDLPGVERLSTGLSDPGGHGPPWENAQQPLAKGSLVWHKVPGVPGPHLFQYVCWFFANHLWRWWGRKFQKLSFDLLYSPGINCLDAGVISVHIVFAEFYRQVRGELRFLRNPVRTWPRLLHRRLYYRLILWLEHYLYTHRDRPLIAISRKVADDLVRFHGRSNQVTVSYYGLDLAQFNPQVRARLRSEARRTLGLRPEWFCLLLVGNDWKKKGLRCLLEALAQIESPEVKVVVAGHDDPGPFDLLARRLGQEGRVSFHPPRSDVEFYYAAADVYVAPSLEDAFALPPAEAMACGVPVIVSCQAGASEWITPFKDGLVLRRPADPAELAGLIRRLQSDPQLCHSLGENAVKTAMRYTWDANAKHLAEVIEAALARRAGLLTEEARATHVS